MVRRYLLSLLLTLLFASESFSAAGYSPGPVPNSARRVIEMTRFSGIFSDYMDDSYSWAKIIIPGRAGVVTQIRITAATVPAGGTNSVTVEKNGSINLLNAASFDPTTIATAYISQAIPLTAINNDLTFIAGDTIEVTYNSGVQTVPAQSPVVEVEYQLNDF